ncbi:ABC transporter ATP-binding protein [Alicyclobacillus shizuokensis]|uniref:ABC transporter ATP-binding protein n=1 Tax=Alicyclobacillus shizuokensis TaxID=392014 RepID=UPI0008306646|nr:ABC transporter ATP-binding protein [Alicyclobacillus shizuokensis]
MPAAVEIRELTKTLGRRPVVDHLSLDIQPGEVFGLLGPNGAGKTTTIRMMVGLISITHGHVRIHGHDIRTEFEEAIRHVGAIVENPEMYKFLSGYDNLRLYARMHKGIGKDRIDEIVRFVGLESAIHKKVKTYSLGMRQRLGLAQALLHNPSVLILDEPTNGLDPAGIRELRDHLRHLAEDQGVAVIVSSHLLTEMELMCDRVAIIQNGRLVQVQTVREQAHQEAQLVEFEVDAADIARQVLADCGQTEVEVSGQTLRLAAARDDIPEINRRLVEHGVAVYAIQSRTKSLEDQFLEVTGGGQHAAAHSQ